MPKPRSVTRDDVTGIEWGIRQLRLAKQAFDKAGATQAGKAVARTLKSADGARRHAEGLLSRQERGEQ